MNIENKERLFSQIQRVLRPEGLLAVITICAGLISPIFFPVIRANNPTISFLLSPNELLQLIVNSGFKDISWKDDSKKILEGIQRMSSKPRSKKSRLFSLDLIVADPFKKWANIVRNLKEGRIAVIHGIFCKMAS